MLAGQHVHLRRPHHGFLGFRFVAEFVPVDGHRADQDRAIVEKPVGPAELEEGIGEDQDEPDHLDLEHRPGGHGGKRQFAKHVQHAVARSEQGEAAAHRDQRARPEEGGALLQAEHDRGVDHAQFAPRHGAHPGRALDVHGPGQRDATEQLAVGGQRVECPRRQEER